MQKMGTFIMHIKITEQNSGQHDTVKHLSKQSTLASKNNFEN